jgi:hypothetical protein
VHRNWSATTKLIGLAAAVAGALVGARLGFDATGDLLAVLTATAGAIAGANLTLILLDMSRARHANQLAAETAVDTRPATLEPAAPTGT